MNRTTLISADEKNWIHLDEVDSTNSYVSREKVPSGSIVIAQRQTAGRGRAGRKWNADPRDSLLFSLCLEGKPESFYNIPLIPLMCGYALHCAISEIRSESEDKIFIKWPNDIYIKRSGLTGKAAGILIETDWPNSGSVRITAGMGINFSGVPESVENPRKMPVSLFPQIINPEDNQNQYRNQNENQNKNKDDFLKSVINKINSIFSDYLTGAGDITDLIYNINQHLYREDLYTGTDGKRWNVADIAPDGRLRVFSEDKNPPEYTLLSQAE
jgi:biotin-[acetyl-CoA-carboxylase] ligase BirA-like protein